MTIYADYTRARIGFFFGLSGWQLGAVSLGVLPVLWSIQQHAWRSALVFAISWCILALLVVVPIRGRSATGWLLAMLAYTIGMLTGRIPFRSRAATGRLEDPAEPDLPGALAGVEVHEGPPSGPAQSRFAVVQNHAARTWAMTAELVHPGIGMADVDQRSLYGIGMSELVDLCARTELVDELHLIVRSVPEDGTERVQWMNRHRRPGAPEAARVVNDELHQTLTQASVRTEAFLTVVVPETRLAKEAKEAGGGLGGRSRVLYLLAAEIEGQLRDGLGASQVEWLTSPALATATRTAFAPGDRASIIAANSEREQDEGVNDEVPWGMTAASGTDQLIRHYSHDAWNTVSATVRLPVKGAVMGALAPIMVPADPGERRSLAVVFPVINQTKADRQAGTTEWIADLGEALREKAQVRQRTKARDETDRVRALESKLARGNAMVMPYAVASVTVPKTWRIAEYGRRLDASIRRAGFAPQRLDIAQDLGFVASTVPLGVSLARGRS